MQEVLAEIQKAGVLDPATQEQLIRDLQQVDPSMWPQMAMQFRAQLAYAQRSQAKRAETAVAPPAPPAAPPATSPVQQVSYTTSEPVDRVEKTTSKPIVSVASPAEKSAKPAASAASSSPKASASEKASAGDWREHVAAAIGDLEKEKETASPDDEKSSAEVQRQVQKRMLHRLAGRRDDAVRPVTASSAATQGFWSEQFYGLSMLLEEQGDGQSPQRRTAEAKTHLGAAVQRLGENCPLVVRNLAFAKRIQSYGCIDQFDTYEFTPGQPVLLYAEVENLINQSTPKGYHTAVKSSYQIFDSRGQRLAEDQFTHTEEYCRNPRRDYFVGYELHLPDRVYSGSYTLQLTIEDLKSHKIGQASVDFTVNEGKEVKESKEKKR